VGAELVLVEGRLAVSAPRALDRRRLPPATAYAERATAPQPLPLSLPRRQALSLYTRAGLPAPAPLVDFLVL
jgi:hypothetical protein